MSQFYIDNFNFIRYSSEHYLSIGISFILFSTILYLGIAKKNEQSQRRFLIGFCLWLFGVQMMKLFIKLYLGNFDHTEDLPLHLCNFLPLLFAFSLFTKRRIYWAICFLLIMTGTAQSLVTPTLIHSFPHYEAFRYWIIHMGLVLVVFVPLIIWRYRLQIKDIFWGWVSINVLAFSVYGINEILGSNYMYMQGKPPGDTIYTILGPWPWYILTLEFVSVLLFTIVYLPFGLLAYTNRRRL